MVWLDDRGTGQWKEWKKFRVAPRSHPLRPLFVLCFLGVETEGLLDYQERAGIISIVQWNLRPVIFGEVTFGSCKGTVLGAPPLPPQVPKNAQKQLGHILVKKAWSDSQVVQRYRIQKAPRMPKYSWPLKSAPPAWFEVLDIFRIVARKLFIQCGLFGWQLSFRTSAYCSYSFLVLQTSIQLQEIIRWGGVQECSAIRLQEVSVFKLNR